MKSLVTAALVVLLTLAAGCSLFHRHKGNQPAPLPPARAVETEYRARWMQKRVGELLASGAAKTDAEAQTMAADEFARLYPFISPPPGKPGR